MPRRPRAASGGLVYHVLDRAVGRGAPYGTERWQTQTALRLGLGSSLRPSGRPRKEPTKAE